MITVVDLEISNINSVTRALSYLKIPHDVTASCSKIEKADKLILPGVGNFSAASKRLHSSGLREAIRCVAIEKKRPLLGICLGMQLLAETSEEGGVSEGLGLIPAKVVRLNSEKMGCRLPHIGWNDVADNQLSLFKGVPENSCFYFVHSYEMVLCDEAVKKATSHYGSDFVAAVQSDNVMGTQFHPEKSQKLGLQILSNFAQGAQ